MKVAILLCTYNRPEYLRECLWALERADLSKVDTFMIVDDASTDAETINLIKGANFKDSYSNLTIKTHNKGIKDSLLTGYEYLFKNNDIVINLDSDAIVRPDFVNKLLEAHSLLDNAILTGFHCTTKNANGTDRHKIINDLNSVDLYYKQSVGGINFCIDKEAYEKYMKPALNMHGNFDHNACILAGGAYCLKQSVIQHIGFDSSMGHIEQPDIADDFYYWDLPNVTLLGVDSNKERLQVAADKCTKWIKFGRVVMLHPNINSKEAYSRFIIKEAYKHVETSHVLIFQHDGFVNNWKAWDNDWLKYDYIGATWWYNDGMNVGNGGFSLRSKRLMEILATDPQIQLLHPEDHHICRTYRPYLENKYGIKFAPESVADKFSYEGYRQPGKSLGEQFGVHGSRNMKQKTGRKYVVNQFAGLGDILFLVPLIRALMDEGNDVTWPIADHYFEISKHFSDINMVRKSSIYVPYDYRGMVETTYGKMLPYRFAIEIMGLTMRDCMKAKYTLYGHDYNMWRELTWKRDYENEARLIKLVSAIGEYVLVNRHYGAAEHGMTITPELPEGKRVVEMKTIPGFTLIDWCGVIEGASEIHVANSSVNYLIELMNVKVPVYMYKRSLWGESNFEHTDYLWQNKCWIYKY